MRRYVYLLPLVLPPLCCLSCATLGTQEKIEARKVTIIAVMPTICDFAGGTGERRTIAGYTRAIVFDKLSPRARLVDRDAVDSLITALGVRYFTLSEDDPLAGFVQKEAGVVSPEDFTGLRAVQESSKCQALVLTWLKLGAGMKENAKNVKGNAVMLSAAVVDFSGPEPEYLWRRGGVIVAELEAQDNYGLFKLDKSKSPADVLNPDLVRESVEKLFDSVDEIIGPR